MTRRVRAIGLLMGVSGALTAGAAFGALCESGFNLYGIVTMAKPHSSLILKVLSGPQQGAEIALEAGDFSFGSDAACDIQFTDVSVAPHHGVLRIAAGKVEIKAQDKDLQMASGLEIDAGAPEWREVAQLDQITAGTLRFALGARDADWASLTAPLPDPVAKPAKTDLREKLNLKTLALACLVIIGCLGGVVAATSSGSNLGLRPASSPQQDYAKVVEAIAALPFDHRLSADQKADGEIIVTGYVRDVVERRAARHALSATDAPAHGRIWALDALETDVVGLLESQSLDLSHALAPDGKLTLSGIHLDSGKVTEVVSLIENEVFGLAGIQNEIRTADFYLSEVQELITQLQLSNLVLARIDGNLIETTGVVPLDLTDSWADFMRAYSRRYAAIIPLRSFVTLEGQSATPSVPVILSQTNSGVAGEGRVLTAQTFADDTPNTADLFAGAAPQALAALPETIIATINTLTQAGSDERIDRLISAFVAENPELVATLLQNITNGAVSDIDTLRAYFDEYARDASAEEDSVSLASAPLEGSNTQSARDPLPYVQLLTAAPASLPGQPDTDVKGIAEKALATIREDAQQVLDRGPDDPSSLGFAASATAFNANEAEQILIESGKRLLGDAQSDPTIPAATDPTALTRLRASSPELIDLVQAQNQSLAVGETLLSPPGPLSALPNYAPQGQTCWAGSKLSLEALPTILMWMDILSTDATVDLMEVNSTIRPLLLEATLSPARIEGCLEQIASQFSRRLQRASVFLRESALNDRFAQFMLRNVPRYDLAVDGVNLRGERYLQLASGRKLSEGAAPELASRVAAIGDLGVLIRMAEGYQVKLYDTQIGWVVSP